MAKYGTIIKQFGHSDCRSATSREAWGEGEIVSFNIPRKKTVLCLRNRFKTLDLKSL